MKVTKLKQNVLPETIKNWGMQKKHAITPRNTRFMQKKHKYCRPKHSNKIKIFKKCITIISVLYCTNKEKRDYFLQVVCYKLIKNN